ncbi:MAG: hypothetical protein ABR920_01415 [Terriglobales bacterium]
MKSSSYAVLAVSLLTLNLSASAREMVLPAGTLLQCTMNEPNFSSSTVAVGDPVLCHLHSVTEFGQQAFPRGSYLVGHLESAQDPGHFWGKGNMKLRFDRIGLPNGDMPLDAKVIATRGYKVNKDGDIRGKGHAKRDIVEWMLPPLWPWKIIMLPARGPRPTLKGESMLTLRLMDDVQIPQVSATNGPDWHFFGRPRMENDSYYRGSAYNGSSDNSIPQLAVRQVTPAASEQPVAEEIPQVTYASYIAKDAVGGGGAAPGVPVFVLKTGMVLEVGNYTYQDGRISYELASGGNGVISTDEVDWSTTTRVNSQRGVRVTLRGGHPSAGVAGF